MRLRPYKTMDAAHVTQWIEGREAFAKWCADLIAYPLTEASMAAVATQYEAMENGWFFTALDEGGTPIGFFMMRANYQENSSHLGFVVVDPTKRGRGYGQEMIRLAVQYSYQILGVERVTLSVFDCNENAHSCYLKVGFRDECHEEGCFIFEGKAWGRYKMAIGAKAAD